MRINGLSSSSDNPQSWETVRETQKPQNEQPSGSPNEWLARGIQNVKCAKPFRKGQMEFGCGQCNPCRINRTRLWIGRMILESFDHEYSAFVTLTYAPDFLPSDGSVSKRAVQLFIKRLRKQVAPRTIRFYAVGEYGDRSWRPHYHLIVFGLSPTEEVCVQRAWPEGMIHMGKAEHRTFSYVSGYIVKRMTKPKDARLKGRAPEFSLMSRQPGLGFGAIARYQKAYGTERGKAALEKYQTICDKFKMDGHTYPIGRYLREKALDACGISEDVRKMRSVAQQVATYEEKSLLSTADYERRRKACVDQAAWRARNKLKSKL